MRNQIWITSAVVAILLLGCNDKDNPTGPSFPNGIGIARMLENLPLVLNLERQSRSETTLARINGFTTMDGRTSPGDAWIYTFADRNISRLFIWTVRDTGDIEFNGPTAPPSPSFPMSDLLGHLLVDSDKILVEARLDKGMSDYVNEYPDAVALFACYWLYGKPVCEVRFMKIGVGCEPTVFINTESGKTELAKTKCE